MSEMFSSLVSGMFAKNSECKTNEETNAGQEPTLVEESNPSRQAASDDQLDLAFCVDCTASMGPYIASAQQNVRTIIQELSTKASVDTRFALIEYRDHPPQDSTFITREHDFTYSLDNIQNSVNGMSAQGGGDGPESVCCAYEKVLRLNWRESATKVVVHIADAPPHGIESSDGFPNGCPSGNDPLQKAHEMKERGIVLYTVGCEPALGHYQFARDFMVAVADITGGQATTLTSAHLLPGVILHGSEEEIVLQRLQDQIQNEVTLEQARCAREGVAFDEEVATRNVWCNLQAQGVQTKQMQTDQQLHAPNSDIFKAGGSLGACRASLPAAAPVAPGRPLAMMGGGMMGGGAPVRRARAMAAPPAASMAAMAPVPMPCSFAAAPPMAPGGADCFSFDYCNEEAKPVSAGATKVEMKTADISLEQVSRMMARKKGSWF
uniref:VWFA domain-containing protein n=1 Tax=Heterosigma akashiwo TaxID=2829 RepID=A0A6S9E666_HETAK|mmetsp:Transcript_20255/g.31278  ORF Transcript_20255/g.31278 Transcript_20255/m.31278 type:complete len:436 (-) Transcript_20255:40-1347(-)